MVVGFNHNFKYKGDVYHVQTEDNGVKNPQIVTLLYSGGRILSSQKTSYADFRHATDLAKRLEELMKKQHQDMLRRLKNGEFDGVIEQMAVGSADTVSSQSVPVPGDAASISPESPVLMAKSIDSIEKTVVGKPDAGETDLEKLILSYLLGTDK